MEGGGHSDHIYVLATRMSAAKSPDLSLLLASCGDVNIKQTPSLWVTVLALGIEGLPESAYLNSPGWDLPSVQIPPCFITEVLLEDETDLALHNLHV